MVIGPVLLGIGLGVLAGHLFAGILIGMGAGITLRSVFSAARTSGRTRDFRRRPVE